MKTVSLFIQFLVGSSLSLDGGDSPSQNSLDSLGEQIKDISSQMRDFQNNLGKDSGQISGQVKKDVAKSALSYGLNAFGGFIPKDIHKQIQEQIIDGALSDFSHHDGETPKKEETSKSNDSNTTGHNGMPGVWDLFKQAFAKNDKKGTEKDDGLVSGWDHAHSLLDTLEKSRNADPTQTSESNALKILSMLKPKNLTELVLAINEEVHIWDLSNTFCKDKLLEIFSLLKGVVLNEDKVEKKNVLLDFFDKLLKYERETGVVGTFNKSIETCLKHDEKVLKLGILKLLYFNEELRSGVANFQLMLTIPMVAVSLMRGDATEAGKSMGRIIRYASNTQLEKVKDSDLEKVDIFACGKGFVTEGLSLGRSMILNAQGGEGVGIGEKEKKFGWIELYKIQMDSLTESKKTCIGSADSKPRSSGDN